MAQFTHNDDASAVRSVLSGNRDAFGRLVERYQPMVHALIRANLGAWGDIDDIAQDTFISAFNSLDKLRNPEKFAGWLASITRHECVRHAKDKKRFERNDVAWREASPTSTTDDPGQRELHSMLVQAVQNLDLQHREILLLYYFSKKDMNEIELALEISRETAKKRLQRARATLELHIASQLREVLETYTPNQQQAARVMGVIAATQPAWILAGSTTAALSALTVMGVPIMSTKAILTAVCVTAAIGLAVVLGYGRVNTALPKSTTEANAPADSPGTVEQTASKEPADEATAKLAGAGLESTPGAAEANVIKDGATPAKAQSAPVVKSQRTTTIGGNPQRTGYFDSPAPLTLPKEKWTVDMSGLPGTMPAVDSKGRVFVSHGQRGADYLSALTADGKPLWDFGPVDATRNLQGPALLSNGNVLYGFRDNQLKAFNPENGNIAWSVDVGTGTSSSVLVDSGDGIYIEAPNDMRLMKLDGATGEILWPHGEFEESGSFSGRSASLSLDEETVYNALRNPLTSFGALQAVDADTGDVLWRFTPDGATKFVTNWATPVVGSDGSVYIQDAETGRLFAIADDGTAGSQLWAYDPTQAGIVQRFEEIGDSRIINETQYRSHDAPRLVATDGDAVYMGVFGYPASVHAVDTDGTPRWHATLSDDVVVGSPVITNDAVYILGGGDDQHAGTNALYCLDRNDGQILWQMNVCPPGGDVGESIALAPDGTIYVATSALNGTGSILRALR